MKKGYAMSLPAWRKSLSVLAFLMIGMMLFLALYTTAPRSNGWLTLAIYWGFYFPMAAYWMRRISRWSGFLG
jgi:hypothetical protein